MHDVEDGICPNSPPGLKCAERAVLVLVLTEGLTGMGAMELAGTLELGAGAGAADEGARVNEGTALDGAGTGALLEGTEAIELAGAVLDLDTAVEDGSGLASSFFAGTVPCWIIKRAWVTSRADSCWPTPEVPSQAPVYHFEPQLEPSAPPEQDFAAPTADALRDLVIESLVKGAMIAVFAMNRDR
jgi:hypothetical protein